LSGVTGEPKPLYQFSRSGFLPDLENSYRWIEVLVNHSFAAFLMVEVVRGLYVPV
jgi:hypothetical protein